MPRKDALTRHQRLENYFIGKIYDLVDATVDRSKYKSPKAQANHILEMLTNLQMEYKQVMIDKCEMPFASGDEKKQL
jgi:hypothetical protein